MTFLDIIMPPIEEKTIVEDIINNTPADSTDNTIVWIIAVVIILVFCLLIANKYRKSNKK